MKLEIDLEDLFAADSEGQSWQEVLHDEVVQYVASNVIPDTKKYMKEAISKAIDETVEQVIKDQMPQLLSDLMDTEYTPVSSYGQKSEPTTVRIQMLKTIQSLMVYKPTSYSSDRNIFTTAVDSLVSTEVDKFKKEFNSQVTKQYVAEVTKFTLQSLRKQFGLDK